MQVCLVPCNSLWEINLATDFLFRYIYVRSGQFLEIFILLENFANLYISFFNIIYVYKWVSRFSPHIQYLILIKDNSICHLYISILFPPWKYHMPIPVHPYTWSRTHTYVYTICFQAYTDILSRKLSLQLFILSVRVADKGCYRDSMIDFRLETRKW